MKNIYLFIFVSLFCLPCFSQSQKVLTLQPGPAEGIDTYICTIFPFEAGYNKGMLITAWTLGGEPYVGKDVLKFDLSQIPPNSTIIDARLSLYFDIYGSWNEHVPPNDSYIKKVTSDWDEMTVCWTNQPSTTMEGKIDLPETTLPQQDLLDIDVKHFVTEWVSDPSSNFGVMIGMYNETPYACLVLSSSDGYIPEKRPKLVVTYLDCTLPVAGFSYIVNGMTSFFQDTSSSAQTWHWDFGDGSTSSLQNPAHSYSNPGKFKVCLTVDDSCGSDTFCDSVEIICDKPTAKWGYSNNGTLVYFFDSTASASSWFWDFGDGYSSSLKNPIHNYESEGKYFVCLTVVDSCGSDIHCDTVQTCNPLLASFSYQNQGHFVMFSDSSDQSISWYWDFGDGFMSVLQNPVHYYEEFGTYYVCLTVTNYCETKKFCDSVPVVTNGLGGTAVNEISISPNPVRDFLIIRSAGLKDKNTQVTISDSRGEIVAVHSLHGSNEHRIDLGILQKGLYFISIVSGHYIQNKKFIKVD